MKQNYLFFLLIILFSFVGIITLIFYNPNSQFCEKETLTSLSLLQNPFSIALVKKNNQIYISINNRKLYVASSFAKNFYNSIVPLCSDVIYEYQENYFKDNFCLRFLDSKNKEICRGKKLQNGYPVIIKNQNSTSKMYIKESYHWDRIEELIKNFQQDRIVQFLNVLVDKRILKLPEKSSIVLIEIQKENQMQKFMKKETQWFYQDQKLNNANVTSFINQILMLEQYLKFFNVEISPQNLEKWFSINLTLDFESWKYSLFQNPKIHLVFYKSGNQYILENTNQYYFLEPQAMDLILKNIENMIEKEK